MRSSYALILVAAACVAFTGCADDTNTDGGFVEETVDGPAPGKSDDANTIAFGEFDFYVPPTSSIDEPLHRMITTRDAYERVFGEEPLWFVDFDREWMVLVSAGDQSESGVTVEVTEVRYADSGQSIEVLTKTSAAGKDCETSNATYRPFKLITFPKPETVPQAVRYYPEEETFECSVSACEADALSLITAASEGVNYTSEGDASFEPFFLPGGAEVTDEAALAEALGEPEGEPISVRDFEGWDWRTEVDDPDSGWQVREGAAYENIESLYLEHFQNPRVVRVGEVEVRVYLVGETSCGDLAVLKTISIET